MFSSNGFRVLSAEAIVSAPVDAPIDAPIVEAAAAPVVDVLDEGESRLTTLVPTNGTMATLKAYLSSLGLSQSVFYSRLRVAKKEATDAGKEFVSPFSPMGMGLQTIAADSEYFEASEGGGRSGKYVCVYVGGDIVEVSEADLAAAKTREGFVAAIRVGGRWCFETQSMSDKYPELKRKAKPDDVVAATPDATPDATPVVDATLEATPVVDATPAATPVATPDATTRSKKQAKAS